MKTILFMATSVNGMIADKNGDEDFLSHKNWETFVLTAQEIGNFIVGRKTHEALKNWDADYSFDDLPELDRVVVSTNETTALDKGYILATSPGDALKKLAEKGHEVALVAGGSHINSHFAELFDEIQINIEPVLVGEGIPLFSPRDFTLQLELIDSHNIGEGIIQLRYKVLK